jgi:hypothetical protein
LASFYSGDGRLTPHGHGGRRVASSPLPKDDRLTGRSISGYKNTGESRDNTGLTGTEANLTTNPTHQCTRAAHDRATTPKHRSVLFRSRTSTKIGEGIPRVTAPWECDEKVVRYIRKKKEQTSNSSPD